MSVEVWWSGRYRERKILFECQFVHHKSLSAVRSSRVTASATTYRSTFLETKLKKQHCEIYGLKILCLCLSDVLDWSPGGLEVNLD